MSEQSKGEHPCGEPLRNAGHEKYAQLRARSQPYKDAYELAGYKPGARNAWQIEKRPDVQARVTYLRLCSQEKAIAEQHVPLEKIRATRSYVIERLIENAEIAMGKIPVRQTIAVKRRGQSPATVSIEVTDRNAHAANKALELLGKEVGLFEGASSPQNTGEIDETTKLLRQDLPPDVIRDLLLKEEGAGKP